MESTTGKRTARLRLTLNKGNVAALEPSDKPFIAWDDKLIGFGVRVQPSGLKSFIVNYRAGDGGRKAPNKRVVIGRFGPVTPDQARRIAYKMLGKVADGQDPADKRARARTMPTLDEAFLDYLSAKSYRSAKTGRTYRSAIERHLSDWVSRPLDAIERREVEARFILLSSKHGWAIGNQVISLLRSVYRRACVDHEGLRNPVDLWLAAGGRFNPIVRRVISSPAEALPYWRRGIEAVVKDPATRSIFWVAMYSGLTAQAYRADFRAARETSPGPARSGLVRPDGAGRHPPAAGIVEHTMSAEAIAIVGAAVGLLKLSNKVEAFVFKTAETQSQKVVKPTIKVKNDKQSALTYVVAIFIQGSFITFH